MNVLKLAIVVLFFKGDATLVNGYIRVHLDRADALLIIIKLYLPFSTCKYIPCKKEYVLVLSHVVRTKKYDKYIYNVL